MPAEGQVHFPQLLIQVSCRFQNEEYIATDVFPKVPVVKETDKIPVYGTEGLRREQSYRPNKSQARQVTYSVSNTTYFLQDHALKDIVTERDRQNTDVPLGPDIDATLNLTDKILLDVEIAAFQLAFTTTTWGTNSPLVSTTSWRFNTTTSDPMVAAHSAASSILLRSAKRPNQAVIGYDAYALLRDHVSILDRIKYTQLGQVTPGLIAALWDVDQLVIGTAVNDTGVEGISSSNTAVWEGSKALFMYVPDSPGLRQVSAGYFLTRTPAGTPPAGVDAEGPFTVKQWYDQSYDGTWIEVGTSWAFKAVATNAAYLYTSVNL